MRDEMGEVLETAPGMKRCSRCKQIKPFSEFHRDKRAKGGIRGMCKGCYNNYEEVNRRSRWSARSLLAHKKSGFTIVITLEELTTLAEKTDHCPICGVRLEWGYGLGKGPKSNTPTLDRRYNGHRLSLQSCWIICSQCNMMKSNKPLPELVEWCRIVVDKFGGEDL